MYHSTIIIGAGPAGLAVASALKKQGIEPIILEQTNELAHSWKTHYDRLKLNSIKQLSALPFMPMPADYPRYPSRAQIVSYLEDYARHFDIKPLLNTKVLNIDWLGDEWEVNCNHGKYTATNVIVATGFNHTKRIPEITGLSTFAGQKMHSKEFKNGAAFKGMRVLVIGAGNSGGEIALDLLEHGANVSISIRNPIHIAPLELFGLLPAQLTSTLLDTLPLPIADVIAGMTLKMVVGDLSKYGIKRPNKGPLRTLVEENRVAMFDTGIVKAIKDGKVHVMPAINYVSEKSFVFSDGQSKEFDAVIYATGYDHDLGAMLNKLIASRAFTNSLGEDGYPVHSGKNVGHGLYFIGFKESPRGMLADIRKQAIEIANLISL
jgi:cation diffusion facilitator CzcD-associated flavoprotein CzcO